LNSLEGLFLSLFQRITGKIKRTLDQWLYPAFATLPVLSGLYYGLFSGRFNREHRAVLQGRKIYAQQSGSFLLRRNVHRLEKGLIMRPRRDVFAREYIEETITAYHQQQQNAGCDAGLLKWAHDVLAEYFSVVQDSPEILRARELFMAGPRGNNSAAGAGNDAENNAENRFMPYRRDLAPLAIGIDDFEALCKRRRSVRWFEQKPVPRPLIDRALAAGIQAPSACNRQPYDFRIFDDKEMVQKILEIPMGSKGFAENVPALAVVVGHLDAYFDERDRHVIYIDSSLASMGFLLALETQGLSSCILNWPDMEPQESQMEELLNLGPAERVVMLIVFGYPDPEGSVPFSCKKSLDNIRTYNAPPLNTPRINPLDENQTS